MYYQSGAFLRILSSKMCQKTKFKNDFLLVASWCSAISACLQIQATLVPKLVEVKKQIFAMVSRIVNIFIFSNKIHPRSSLISWENNITTSTMKEQNINEGQNVPPPCLNDEKGNYNFKGYVGFLAALNYSAVLIHHYRHATADQAPAQLEKHKIHKKKIKKALCGNLKKFQTEW